MTDTRPLNVLTIDGGGVRGLSSLLILRTLMGSLKERSGWPTMPLPCEIFDVICGTSTGGLIAIMLGRLRMSVEDAITHYRAFCQRVFGNPKLFGLFRRLVGSPMYDASTLEESIKEIVARFDATNHSREAPLEDPAAEKPDGGCCNTFVVAISQAHADAPPALFRSYTAGSGQTNTFTVWEAVRATTATSRFFEPATVGTPPQTFLDSAFVANNPSFLALDEVRERFPNRPINCFLSLGTGVPYIVGITGNLLDIAKACQKLAESCEGVAQDVARRFRVDSETNHQPNPFFRFSVNRGLETIQLDEWMREGELGGITDAYMRFHNQKSKADRCVEALKSRAEQVLAMREIENTLL